MDKQWSAKWIMDPRFAEFTPLNLLHKQLASFSLPEHRPDLQNHHMLVRKTFQWKKEPNNAFLDITADDYYKLYINGEFVGQGPAPGYSWHYFYNRYDVTKYLKNGLNVIAVHVFYQGLINRVWNSGDYRQGMLAELQIDGGLVLATDHSWKYHIASEYTGRETFGYETQFVEMIDSRLKEEAWRDPDYDDRHWGDSYENKADDHHLVLQDTPILQIYTMKPAQILNPAPGYYWIDFGLEITGQFTMLAQGTAGQQVEIRYGEELEADGKRVRYPMRCNCNYRDTWTLSGAVDLLETFDYKAFRYVELSAPEGVLQPDSFAALVRHYPLGETQCCFSSSDPLVNKIWNICAHGVRCGAQEVFVDCPSREKGQYLGDATITSHSHMYLSGDLRLTKKMLEDFSRSARICPGLMAVAPGAFMQEIADFSLQWPLQLYQYYQQSGDIQFLQEMAPVAEGIIQYFKKFQRPDGLLENVKEKWNLVDWPENLRDDYDFDLSQPVVGDGCHNVINAFFCGAVQTVNRIHDILGISYQDELPELKEAFIKAFYRPELKLLADSTVSNHTALHANSIALFFDLVPMEAHQNVVGLIRKKRMKCGVYNAYFLLKGLARIGEYDLVYQLLTSTDEHSWANMIREGATACFEAWGKEQKWNTSLCHPWASAPLPILIEDIAGLKPAKAGWSEAFFSPHIPEELKYLEVKFWTVQGCFHMVVNNGRMELEAPPGVKIVTVKS
jgi:alpha-L-rhamnosidase